MIPNTDFYSAYLTNHFKIKAKLSSYLLSLDKEQIENMISQIGLKINDVEFLKTVKIDLIQAFNQSVESLFGFMHSLEKVESTTAIPDYLVSASISDLHKFIESFKDFNFCCNYLESKVKTDKIKDIPMYKWLFYFISVLAENVPYQVVESIEKEANIKGIAFTLNNIAKLFNKEPHNSIKHGLRCILISELNINIDIPEEFNIPQLPEELKKFKGNDILMYYIKGPKGDKAATIVLVPIDIKQFIYMHDSINRLLFN